MKNKTQLLTFILFAIFFFVGWQFGFSPIKESLEKFNDSKNSIKQLVKNAPYFEPQIDYMTENQSGIDIIHYDMNLDLYPDKRLLIGDVSVTGVVIDESFRAIDLNLYDNLVVSEVTLNNTITEFTHEDKILSVPFSGSSGDTFNVNIKYSGTPERAGLTAFAFGEKFGGSVVYNLNEPNYASTWFPCKDVPDDKALLDMKITNDSSKTSISNGKFISTTLNGSRKTYHWKTYYPISTYLICIYSADYVNFNDQYISQDGIDTMDIMYYVFPEHLENAKIDFEDHPEMIEYFSDTFGEYPFIKEKYGVAEFLWQMGAMEHQTITGIGSNFVGGRKFFNDIYVHELAHHWWGNAVGPKTWKDIWLNEGFATYSEVMYTEAKHGKDALHSKMLSKFSENFSGTLYNPGGFLFSPTVYDKGAWVLHMLRWETGDSTFVNILRTYFERFKYKNASTNDFKELCEELTGKDFDQFYDQWVYEGEGIAKLDYSWKIKKENENSYIAIINIEQVQNDYGVYHFPLQILFHYDDESDNIYKKFIIDKKQTELTVKLNKRPTDIIPDPDNWLLALITDKNSYE